MQDNSDTIIYHTPVLFEESIRALDIHPDGIYADSTFGGGGHSRGIITRLSPAGHLYGFDQDVDAIENALPDENFTFVRSNFEFMPNFLRFYGVDKVDGILADLGVSSHHFDDAERGFSFRADAPLDMRMNRRAPLTAADIINDSSEDELIRIFRLGSDLNNIKGFAKAIIKKRGEHPILTTTELISAVSPLINPRSEKKDLAQVFQALRIAVNKEMDVLIRFLQSASEMLRPGGRLAVITYHSLEDRLVKNLMKTGNVEGKVDKDFFGKVSTPWKLITRSPITPTPEELERNPRARSAKLRVAELLPQ
ncbi:MAG: 16S rRNA (cytosine(1402)-N(4))-methyltransferase RsmH [Bacteroides sp.]|nr:16S rRNA (cytosine(1402)-N(4))-methyltransferase RsmH [Bacteroides sp.]